MSKRRLYFLKPTTPFAEAVVRSTTNGRVEFWLGGVSARSLRAADRGAVFTAIDSTGRVLGEVQQESRRGLVGIGKLVGSLDLKPGTFLRERIRGVPTDLKLRVAIDPSWGNQEAEVKAALQTVDRLEVVAIGQPADFLLGRVTALQKQTRSSLPPVGSVGLFTAGLKPLEPSFDRADETIAEAVNRLRPRFKSLLAGRILQLAVGGDAAHRLQVETTVLPKGVRATEITTRQFKVGTEFQVRVKNNERRGLYVAVLTIGGGGNLTMLYPYWDAPEQAALLVPGEELLTPKPEDDWQFTVQGVGAVEVMVLVSTQPLRDTLKAVSTIARSRGVGQRSALSLRGDESLNIVAALLGDCDRHARDGDADVVVTRVKRSIDATQLAAISTVIQVVK